jgi:hypothetical protein
MVPPPLQPTVVPLTIGGNRVVALCPAAALATITVDAGQTWSEERFVD